MGPPSSAADYTEARLSLDALSKTHAPGVYLFRSNTHSFREGIKPDALLIVDCCARPVDGSLVLCVLEDEFRIQRLRLYPGAHIEELDNPDKKRKLPAGDEEGIEIKGVVTHIVNDAQTEVFDVRPVM